MAINLYDTHSMLALQEAVKPKATFLRDRYFPTRDGDIFTSEDVIVDFKDETDLTLAPAVIPAKGGIQVERGGYKTHSFEPPLIAPERVLTASQLLKRQAGEQVFSSVSPKEREAKILTQDMADLNTMIDNREEYMAAQVLLNGGYTLKQYADKYGDASEYVEKQLVFYEGGSNPYTYTPSTKWDNSGDIIADIAAMAQMLTKRGLPATDLIVSGAVADVMLSDATVLKLLDNRRFILAQEVNPQENADGSVLIAVLNVKGHLINVFSYTRQYRSEAKSGSPLVYTMEDFIPTNYAIMTAPGMGRTAYGAITQMEESGDFVTYAAKRVPHVITDAASSTRTLIQQSRPLVMPKILGSAISANVLT